MTTDRTQPARPAALNDRSSAAQAERRPEGAFAALLDAHAPAPRREEPQARRDGVREHGPEPRDAAPRHDQAPGTAPDTSAPDAGPQEQPSAERPVALPAVPAGEPVALPVAAPAAAAAPAPAPAAPVAPLFLVAPEAVAAAPVAAPPAVAVPAPTEATAPAPAPAPAVPAAALPGAPAQPAAPAAPAPAAAQAPVAVPAEEAAPAPVPAATPQAPAPEAQKPAAPVVPAAAEAPAPAAPEAPAAHEAPAAAAHAPARTVATPEPAAAAPAPVAQTPAGESFASAPVTTAPVSGLAAPERTVPLYRAAAAVGTLLHVAVDRGISRAKIALRPAELGGIEIRLTAAAGGITAHVVADSPEAARLLAQAGDDLRRALESRDVTLISLEVSTSGERQQQNARGEWTDGDDAAFFGAGRSSSGDAEGDAEPAPTSTQTVIELPGGLLVDVLA